MDAVVITHNSAGDLAGLLSCVPLRAAFDRVVVVDNASSDGSREVAADAGAEVIALPENLGFAAACNHGAAAARGELVAFLNPDVRFLEPEATEWLAAHFADPAVAVAAPALVLPDGRLQDSARRVPTPLDLVVRRLLGSRRGAIWADAPRDVPWVVGACLVMRRRALETLCGFDEKFRLYFEDVDLCVRACRDGWRVVLDPRVRVLHAHRAASRRFGAAAWLHGSSSRRPDEPASHPARDRERRRHRCRADRALRRRHAPRARLRRHARVPPGTARATRA
jgi:N-acetylglucosaminyl-diphospho-decaprenol L-rhamnosyltransferase